MGRTIPKSAMECRLCSKPKKASNLCELFGSNREKLNQIQDLTGLVLKDTSNLPRGICRPCQRDLEQSHKFRERCIKTQEYYATTSTETKPSTNEETGGKYRYKRKAHIASNVCDEKTVKKERRSRLKQHDFELEDNVEMDIDDNISFQCETDVLVEEVKIELDTEEPDEVEEFIALEPCGVEPEEKDDFEIRKKRRLREKKPNNFICDHCGNHFTNRHHFHVHLRRHTGDKRYHCEICPNKFFTHSELKRHMRRHTGERPFACKHCDRRFTDYSTRIKHERTHTNERPFSCPQCGKAFTTSYVLKNHMLVHTGERSFNCALCNKAFQRQTHLVVHCRSIMHKQNEEKQKQNGKIEMFAAIPLEKK